MKRNSSVKTNTTDDKDLIYMHLSCASTFGGDVYINEGDNHSLLKKACISEVSREGEGSFILKDASRFEPVVNETTLFRLKKDFSRMDFSSPCTTVNSIKSNDSKFAFPKFVTLLFIREYIRIKPMKNKPILVNFGSNGAEDKLSFARARDISIGGIGIEYPGVELIFKLGQFIDPMYVILPERISLILCGQIKSLCRNRCGIEFMDNDSRTTGLIFKYILQHETESGRLSPDIETDLNLYKSVFPNKVSNESHKFGMAVSRRSI